MGTLLTRDRSGAGTTFSSRPRDSIGNGDILLAMAGVHPNRMVRGIYLGIGVVLVVVGLIGIVLPLIPTAFPIILAGFFFSRSSERFDAWLVSHRVFGPIVRDWRAGVGFTARAKSIAVLGIALTFTTSIVFFVDQAWLKGLLALGAMVIAGYVLSLPTKPAQPASDSARA